MPTPSYRSVPTQNPTASQAERSLSAVLSPYADARQETNQMALRLKAEENAYALKLLEMEHAENKKREAERLADEKYDRRLADEREHAAGVRAEVREQQLADRAEAREQQLDDAAEAEARRMFDEQRRWEETQRLEERQDKKDEQARLRGAAEAATDEGVEGGAIGGIVDDPQMTVDQKVTELKRLKREAMDKALSGKAIDQYELKYVELGGNLSDIEGHRREDGSRVGSVQEQKIRLLNAIRAQSDQRDEDKINRQIEKQRFEANKTEHKKLVAKAKAMGLDIKDYTHWKKSMRKDGETWNYEELPEDDQVKRVGELREFVERSDVTRTNNWYYRELEKLNRDTDRMAAKAKQAIPGFSTADIISGVQDAKLKEWGFTETQITTLMAPGGLQALRSLNPPGRDTAQLDAAINSLVEHIGTKKAEILENQPEGSVFDAMKVRELMSRANRLIGERDKRFKAATADYRLYLPADQGGLATPRTPGPPTSGAPAPGASVPVTPGAAGGAAGVVPATPPTPPTPGASVPQISDTLGGLGFRPDQVAALEQASLALGKNKDYWKSQTYRHRDFTEPADPLPAGGSGPEAVLQEMSNQLRETHQAWIAKQNNLGLTRLPGGGFKARPGMNIAQQEAAMNDYNRLASERNSLTQANNRILNALKPPAPAPSVPTPAPTPAPTLPPPAPAPTPIPMEPGSDSGGPSPILPGGTGDAGRSVPAAPAGRGTPGLSEGRLSALLRAPSTAGHDRPDEVTGYGNNPFLQSEGKVAPLSVPSPITGPAGGRPAGSVPHALAPPPSGTGAPLPLAPAGIRPELIKLANEMAEKIAKGDIELAALEAQLNHAFKTLREHEQSLTEEQLSGLRDSVIMYNMAIERSKGLSLPSLPPLPAVPPLPGPSIPRQ